MRLSNIFLVLSATLFVTGSAYPNGDDIVRILQTNEAAPHSQERGRGGFHGLDSKEEPFMSDAEVKAGLASLDVNLLCDDVTNVTLYVPQGNITYLNGYVTAVPDGKPTIWTLARDKKTGGFQITTTDPFDRVLKWIGNYEGALEVGYDDYSQIRYQIRLRTIGRESQLVFLAPQGGCLIFNPDGKSVLTSNNPCHPVSFRKITPEKWENPMEPSNSCTKSVLAKLENMTSKVFPNRLAGAGAGADDEMHEEFFSLIAQGVTWAVKEITGYTIY